MPEAPPLLFWDFENVMSERGVSTAVGVPSEPALISGFISQTGGGPAEVFGDGVGTVFLTRNLGTNDVFLWVTVTQPVRVLALALRHWHNHNPGYPTHPGYRVQLQLDAGDGYEKVGPPLELSNANSGGTDSFLIDRVLEPGSYKFRWHPQGLNRKARDTSSEFFAFKNVALHGHVHAGAPEPEPPCPVAAPALSPPVPAPARTGSTQTGYVTVALAGVTVERLKVMESKFPGKCVRSGAEFDSGAVIGFKHRDSLTEEQKAAIFGAKKVGHLVVLLSAEEAATGGTGSGGGTGAPAGAGGSCQPDRDVLAIFYQRGDRTANLPRRCVAYSCGRIVRKGQTVTHRHDPAEWELCRRIATEASRRLTSVPLNNEGDGAPLLPYYVVAELDQPLPAALDAALIRPLYHDTLIGRMQLRVEPLARGGSWWGGQVDAYDDPAERDRVTTTWGGFIDWFRAVPGLRDHSFVMFGLGDDDLDDEDDDSDRGATVYRMAVALTTAGSLVGVGSYEIFG